MTEALNLAYGAIEEQHRDKSAATRRQLVAGAAATFSGMGILGLAQAAEATNGKNDIQTILNVAATAEVLATIVNTIGFRKGLGGDDTTQANIAAAAREELIHYDVLVGKGIGAVPLTKTIYVPDAVFANRTNFLSTLEVGDQIFVNAYLIATTAFAKAGKPDFARFAAEFMGVEGVHRALARQSLGKLGNDRVFMKYNGRERAIDAPNRNAPGFTDVLVAVAQLEAAGFGFGKPQKGVPSQVYYLGRTRPLVPEPGEKINTRRPQ